MKPTKDVRKTKPKARAGAPPEQFVLLIPDHRLIPDRPVFNVAFLPDGRHLFETPEDARVAAREFLDLLEPFSERFRQSGVVAHKARPGEAFIDTPYAVIRDGVAVCAAVEDLTVS